MKKRWAALLCALALTVGQSLAAPTGYLDVPENEWYTAAVMEVSAKGLLQGVGEGNFAPQAPVTRGTVITVLWRMEGRPEAAGKESFADIIPGEEAFWYAGAAAWAKETGVASGYEDGTFGGDNPVTREQMAVFLYNYAKFKGEQVGEGMLGLFKDSSAISDWAQDAVRHAVGMGVIQGDDEGYVNPQGITTRAALAVMLRRMLTPAAG